MQGLRDTLKTAPTQIALIVLWVYIGCKKCGSKLSRKYLTGNYCPLCKNDLRSATVVERLKKLCDKKAEYQAQLNMLENGKVLY